MYKQKRKSSVEFHITPVQRRNSATEKNDEFKTPLIIHSRTKSIERSAPKLIQEKKVDYAENAGIGRVIKYLHARDACMQNDISFQDKKDSIEQINNFDKKNCLKYIFRFLTYGIFILFFTIGILSIYTLFDTDNSRLVEITDLINTVEIPSIQDIYYFNKESKEHIREAFEYLNSIKSNKEINGKVLNNKKFNKNVKDILKKNEKRSLSNLSIEDRNPLNKTVNNSVNKLLVNNKLNNKEKELKGNKLLFDAKKKLNKTDLKQKNVINNWGKIENSNLDYRNEKADKKKDNIIKSESKTNSNIIEKDENSFKLIKLILGDNKLKLMIFNSNILELLCYYDFKYQDGIVNLYYNELDYNLNFEDHFVNSHNNDMIKNLKRNNILSILEFERPYELLVSRSDYKLETETLLKVNRKIIVSSGYDNEDIKKFCLYKNKWSCTKYEILILKLLLEFYNEKETFISYFLKNYKKRVIDKSYMDNIPFFTRNQIMIVDSLFPGLFKTFETMKKGIYEKIYLYEKRENLINRNILQNIQDEDINWIISLVLSHSLQDREENIALVPYYSIIPHSSNIYNDCNIQTIFHSANNKSFEWIYNLKKCNDVNKENKYKKIYTHYGQLNNIKLLVQYGKILGNNGYSTIWFLRKGYFDLKNDLTFINEFNILFGTNVIVNDINSKLSKELLPEWLFNKSEIRIDASEVFVHYISSNKRIEIKKNIDENNLGFIKCNEYTFYNGIGSGFGTIQFTKLGQVGGIQATTYICLREMIFNNHKVLTKEDIEDKLINIIYDSCKKRFKQLFDIKEQLIVTLRHELADNDSLLSLPNKMKQEIRINIKLLYLSLEELKTMSDCTSYFKKLKELKARYSNKN